jgi:hypothetical protein
MTQSNIAGAGRLVNWLLRASHHVGAFGLRNGF